jgi:hypothetical protein
MTPAAPAAASALDVDVALAQLEVMRSLAEQTGDWDGSLVALMRRQFARLDAHFDALAVAQARDPEWTAAVRRLVSHRRPAS